MLKKDNLIIFLIFFSLINLAFNSINPLVSIGFLFLIIFISIILSPKYLVLIPFFIYPLMFIIKNRDPGNITLSVLPEITVILSFTFLLLYQKFITSNKYLFFLLILFCLLTITISYFHVVEIFFIPILIRQYVLPIAFLITFIYASEKKIELPFEALKISIISYGIVSIIALLNNFDVIEVYKYFKPDGGVISRPFIGCMNEFTAPFLDCRKGTQMVRMEALLGGARGSSAGILFMLAIVSILIKDESNKFLKYFSIPLIFTSVLTLSLSIIFPVIYLVLTLIVRKKNIINPLYIFTFFIFFILSITAFDLFGEQSAFSYFRGSLFFGAMSYLSSIDSINIIFGSGPVISSLKFEFYPKNFLLDVGLLRVLTETGFFNFFLFFLIIIFFLKRVFWLQYNHSSKYHQSLMIIILVLLSMIHGNMVIFPPFYPLFVLVASAILVQYRSFKTIK